MCLLQRTVTCPGKGAPQRAAPWSDVAQWGTQESCSVPGLPGRGGNGEQHLQLLMPVVLGAIWVQQCPLKRGGQWEPLGSAGSHLPAGESAGLRPRAHFTINGALKKDLSNFKSVPSYISSSYMKNGLYLLSGGIRNLTLIEVKFFFQPALCACNNAVSQCFWAPVSIQAVGERQFWGILTKLQKMFFPGSVWMAGQMGPEMWLYLKAVLSLDVTFTVFQDLCVT